MTRTTRWLLFGGVGLLVLLGSLAGISWWAVHRVPAFYTRIGELSPATLEPASNAFVRHITTLASDVRKSNNTWQAVFTTEQINGWLAVDLPRNHPHALPPAMNEPRVEIQPGNLTIGARYSGGVGEVVLSLQMDLFLPKDQPDTIAIRIRKFRVGSLPMGKSLIVKGLEQASQEAEWLLRWKQLDGDPVAYLTPLVDNNNPNRAWHIDHLEVLDGEIRIAGHTGQPAH